MANLERSGWRDEWISKFHRKLGDALGMTDLDFVVIEWNQHNGRMIPRAIIDYKVAGADISKSNPSLRAYETVGDILKVPALLVWYRRQAPAQFKIKGINRSGLRHGTPDWIGTRAYAEWLYRLRNMDITEARDYSAVDEFLRDDAAGINSIRMQGDADGIPPL